MTSKLVTAVTAWTMLPAERDDLPFERHPDFAPTVARGGAASISPRCNRDTRCASDFVPYEIGPSVIQRIPGGIKSLQGTRRTRPRAFRAFAGSK